MTWIGCAFSFTGYVNNLLTDVSLETTTDFILLLACNFDLDTLSLIVGMDDWWYFMDLISVFMSCDLVRYFLPDIFEWLLTFDRFGDGFREFISVLFVSLDMSSLH